MLARKITLTDTTNAGWISQDAGSMYVNHHPEEGGIVSLDAHTNTWYVIFNRHDLDPIMGLGNSMRAFCRFYEKLYHY